MKQILLIEDSLKDFNYFSRLLRAHGCSVFPEVDSNDSLMKFLGFDQFTPKMNDKECFNIIRKNIYSYTKKNKLYSTLSAIILDINLLSDTLHDTSGLRFMEDFRNSNGLEFPKQYKQWNKVIPIIALTNYPRDKYEDTFTKYPGYLARMFNKDNVKDNNSVFLNSINNFHEQMSAIYPLFYAPELKKILYRINENTKQQATQLKELEQISKLLLWSNIASMDAQKRNVFADKFADELIEYAKENEAFMEGIEDIESDFKNAILKIFNSPSIKILQICSLFGTKINIDKIPDVIDRASELLKINN